MNKCYWERNCGCGRIKANTRAGAAAGLLPVGIHIILRKESGGQKDGNDNDAEDSCCPCRA